MCSITMLLPVSLYHKTVKDHDIVSPFGVVQLIYITSKESHKLFAELGYNS